MDPLSIIFVPGGLMAGLLLFGAPVVAAGHLVWRWRARRRVARGCCGCCGSAFPGGDERFLVTGISICGRCAAALRRRLSIALPGVAVAACAFAVSSGTAFATSLSRGGPELAWWLDGRWIPLLLPSVGVGLLTWGLVQAAKRANRIASRRGGPDGVAAAAAAQALLPAPNVALQQTEGLRERPSSAFMRSGRS